MRRMTVSLLTVAALSATQAPAWADYPVPFTPVETLAQAAKNNGFTVAPPTQEIPDNAQTRTVAPKVAEKPVPVTLPSVAVGTPIAPKVASLPKNTDVVLKLTVNGKTIVIGTGTTNAKGVVQLPVLKFAKPGTYTITVQLPNGKSAKVKTTVTKKK